MKISSQELPGPEAPRGRTSAGRPTSMAPSKTPLLAGPHSGGQLGARVCRPLRGQNISGSAQAQAARKREGKPTQP